MIFFVFVPLLVVFFILIIVLDTKVYRFAQHEENIATLYSIQQAFIMCDINYLLWLFFIASPFFTLMFALRA